MSQKILFLTGGAGEIGSAIKEKFSIENFLVIAPDRQEMNLEVTGQIEKYLENVTSTVDVFIHCAGFNAPKTLENIAYSDLQKTMQINAFSFYQICQYLVKHHKIKSPGFILGISSIYGFLARPGRFSYSASKQSLNSMIKTLALELGHKKIHVNTLSPGFVDTKMTRRNNDENTIAGFVQKIPLGRLAQPSDIADVAYFLCSSQNKFITGQDIVADGGYSIGDYHIDSEP